MNLSFECNQNPKDMPNKKGNKFCEHCEKNVFDLRRKSTRKINLFFETHPKPCVIIYQHQLDKVTFKPKPLSLTHRYLPYAATVVALVSLQHVTIAQASTKTITAETTINSSFSLQTKKTTFIATANQKYFIKGNLTIADKKLKRKKGKAIIFSIYKNDIVGDFSEDTLAIGKLKSGGNFNIEVTEKVFEIINSKKNKINIEVSDFKRQAYIKEINTIKNVIEIELTIRVKQIRMGKIAKPHF